jgi:hypothetical protein
MSGGYLVMPLLGGAAVFPFGSGRGYSCAATLRTLLLDRARLRAARDGCNQNDDDEHQLR